MSQGTALQRTVPPGRPTSAKTLSRCLFVTLAFAAVEAVAGLRAGSLALVSDAGHMVTDAAGLGLALLAAWMSAGSPTHRYTYGFGRVEIVAAVVNGLLMCALVVWVAAQAVGRIQARPAVDGVMAMTVAGVGLVVNAVVARILLAGERTLNTRAAYLHVMGDLLGSLAALASGAVIVAVDWRPVDPLLSLFICVLILVSAARILREGLHILLEGVPRHLDVPEVGQEMTAVPGVVSVHDLHVWQVSSKDVALSAHVVVVDPDDWEATIERLRVRLRERFGIGHVTLEPERPGRPAPPGVGCAP